MTYYNFPFTGTTYTLLSKEVEGHPQASPKVGGPNYQGGEAYSLRTAVDALDRSRFADRQLTFSHFKKANRPGPVPTDPQPSMKSGDFTSSGRFSIAH